MLLGLPAADSSAQAIVDMRNQLAKESLQSDSPKPC